MPGLRHSRWIAPAVIGLDAEKAASIGHGVCAMAAVNQATVPWCTVIPRNAFGAAGVVFWQN